ncbi:MAG: hypothetical protein HC846_13265 [Blastocatellia bacterium]|nr:hypothetical protein [Blastocatellia bacterium]
MKTLILITLLLIPTFAFSQTVNELFLQIPKDVLPENRTKLITETKGDLLKFRLSEARRGELKIFMQKKDEMLLGMAISDCDSSEIKFWIIKKGVWKVVTNNVIKALGKDDVIAILKASPATITNPNQSLDIAYFYNFFTDSTNIELIARKQDSCEVAGKVYDYKF